MSNICKHFCLSEFLTLPWVHHVSRILHFSFCLTSLNIVFVKFIPVCAGIKSHSLSWLSDVARTYVSHSVYALIS